MIEPVCFAVVGGHGTVGPTGINGRYKLMGMNLSWPNKTSDGFILQKSL